MESQLDEIFGDIDPDDNLINDLFSSNNVGSCEYYSIDRYKQKFTENTSFNFSLINYNVRSFHANFTPFEGVLESMQSSFSVTVLTETRNKPQTSEICEINGYSAYHTLRHGGIIGWRGTRPRFWKPIREPRYLNLLEITLLNKVHIK